MKIISFDLLAEMGFLKKPDINHKIYLTYNTLHKPALLGILGAIAGLKGYEKNGELPIYYQQLKRLKVGIEPLNSDKGNYTKTTVSYNNTTGFASDEEGGNLIVTEQVLVAPAFRCYLLLDTNNAIENTLYQRIINQEAEYLPYLGKNDFSAWWCKDSVAEYEIKTRKTTSAFRISSIFHKGDTTVNKERQNMVADFDMSIDVDNPLFFYFEKLPISFDETLYQYSLADFSFTSAKIKPDTTLEGIYRLQNGRDEKYVQLF